MLVLLARVIRKKSKLRGWSFARSTSTTKEAKDVIEGEMCGLSLKTKENSARSWRQTWILTREVVAHQAKGLIFKIKAVILPFFIY